MRITGSECTELTTNTDQTPIYLYPNPLEDVLRLPHTHTFTRGGNQHTSLIVNNYKTTLTSMRRNDTLEAKTIHILLHNVERVEPAIRSFFHSIISGRKMTSSHCERWVLLVHILPGHNAVWTRKRRTFSTHVSRACFPPPCFSLSSLSTILPLAPASNNLC